MLAVFGVLLLLWQMVWPVVAMDRRRVDPMREIVAQTVLHQGRLTLVRERMQETSALPQFTSGQTSRLLSYLTTQRHAIDLCHDVGVAFPSDDLVGAVSDALEAHGQPIDIQRVMETGPAGERLVRLTDYYGALRGGAPSAEALREALASR
jgi:hypothetical protein